MAKSPDEQSDPRISQVSHGENSPNIIGDHNQVVINPKAGLSEAQKVMLAGKMSAYPQADNLSDMIWCVMGDSDSTRFAMDLVESFRRAGWTLPGNGFSQGFGGMIYKGVAIKLRSPGELNQSPILRDLALTLRSFGIQLDAFIEPSMKPGEFKIIVGVSPHG